MGKFSLREMFYWVTAITVCCAFEASCPGYGGLVAGCSILVAVFCLWAWRGDRRSKTVVTWFVIGTAAVNVLVLLPSAFFGLLGLTGALADISLQENVRAGVVFASIAGVAGANLYLLFAPIRRSGLRFPAIALGVNSALASIGIVAWRQEVDSSSTPVPFPSTSVIGLWLLAGASFSAALLRSLSIKWKDGMQDAVQSKETNDTEAV